MRFEWRSKGEGIDALIAVDDKNTVQEAWDATAPLIEDFLNDMTGLGGKDGASNLDVDEQDPQSWGGLVLTRSDEGDILTIDPEMYWDRIAFWFRARGFDPHTWRRSR
ncbi:MAG: hypothetical protein O3B65_01165 [Chloroflexi bacterium]|nr:hypothetical protein [Chloroflexota bacterium]